MDDITSNKKYNVRAYTSAGITLFPCKPDKSPMYRNWQKTPFDPNLNPDSLPDIYGVLLTPDLMVLDYDPRRDVEGSNQLHELLQSLSIPTSIETFIVQTGSLGYHVYLRKRPEVKLRSKVRGFNAIDIKTAGGLVIGAGSRHPNGNFYTCFRGNPTWLKK